MALLIDLALHMSIIIIGCGLAGRYLAARKSLSKEDRFAYVVVITMIAFGSFIEADLASSGQ